VVGLSRFELL